MLIGIRLTGGFAGIEQDLGSVDSAELDEEIRRKVADRLQRVTDLADGRATLGADRLQYEIEILEPGQAPRKLIIFEDDGTDSNEMQALKDLAAVLGISLD